MLKRHGVDHVFGIPGDYVLGFFDLMTKSDELEVINTCDEQGAGFAADAYARLNGLGAVCVTYCVGGFKLANTTAQAFAEKSPVIVISGAPGVQEQEKDLLLHHRVGDFDTQKRVFDEFTVTGTILDDAHTALDEIDRVIHAALYHRKPVYIELPRDMVLVEGRRGHVHGTSGKGSDKETLHEAITEAVSLINAATKPVIFAGVEVHRYGVQETLLELAAKAGIPVATSILAKSVIPDEAEVALGIYEGATGLARVREYVESSDCVIFLGAFLTDLNLGIYTADIDPTGAIYATNEKLTIHNHRYENISFTEFITSLAASDLVQRELNHPRPPVPPLTMEARPETIITVERFFEFVNAFLCDDTMLVVDIGDALFGANDLYIRQKTEFLSPAYYASLGFAVPGALGAHYARPALRPVVIVGDGAFQMTGMELSTIVRYGLNPIVLVMNNDGYSTERPMLDGPFNDVQPWSYHLLPTILGAGKGFLVATEEELQHALQEAEKNTRSFSIIEVTIHRDDRSPALNRLTSRMAKGVR